MQADAVLPAAVLQALASIDRKLEKIMTDQAAEVQSLADAINVVGQHVSAATATLQQFITDHSAVPSVDLTPVQNAVSALQGADTGLQAIVPVAPTDPGTAPADPIPAPPVTDPSTGVITDGSTAVTDTGGATDTMTTDTGTPPDTSVPS